MILGEGERSLFADFIISLQRVVLYTVRTQLRLAGTAHIHNERRYLTLWF